MKLEGSCHCGRIRFTLRSRTPYPYIHCYCSICRKTQGGSGYAINIMGAARTLKVRGKKYLSIYRAKIDGKKSPGQRHFCSRCASALWVFDPRWPENIYPFASAIDTRLPTSRETVHAMLDFAAPWVNVPKGKSELHCREWPEEAIVDWHRRLRLLKKL